MLDASTGPIAEFAMRLRALRKEAGNPSYRKLAAKTHYSASTLSVAASGTRLPTLEVTLAYVQACGGDPSEWQEYWRSINLEVETAQADTVIHLDNSRPAMFAGRPVAAMKASLQRNLGQLQKLGAAAVCGVLGTAAVLLAQRIRQRRWRVMPKSAQRPAQGPIFAQRRSLRRRS